jgi:hypothetical protein
MKTFALSSVLATLIGLGSFATPAMADHDWRDHRDGWRHRDHREYRRHWQSQRFERRRDARRFERDLRDRGYETRLEGQRGDYVVLYRFER